MSQYVKGEHRILYKIGERDGWYCHYCGRPLAKPNEPVRDLGSDDVDGIMVRRGLVRSTVDHIIPRSEGGATTKQNTVLACKLCNSWKSSVSYNEFMSELQAWMKPNRHILQQIWNEKTPKK